MQALLRNLDERGHSVDHEDVGPTSGTGTNGRDRCSDRALRRTQPISDMGGSAIQIRTSVGRRTGERERKTLVSEQVRGLEIDRRSETISIVIITDH